MNKLFHKHTYNKVGFIECYDKIKCVRYAVGEYVCSKCNKTIFKDMRTMKKISLNKIKKNLRV